MKMLTIAQAQKQLGFCRSYISILLYTGKLKARKGSKRERFAWKITAASVRNYKPPTRS